MSQPDGVSDGQIANEDTFDTSFMKSNGNTGTIGKMDLSNALPESGGFIVNVQKELNNLFTFLGASKNQLIGLLPTFTNSNGFTATQSVFARAEAISAKFHQTTGHKHTGAAGDAPKIESADLASVPLRGYPIAGTDITTPGTNSTNVSALMSLKTPSTGAAVKGVVVTAPYNKVPLFVRTGAEAGDYVTDALGNHVYGRLTYSAGVWTLTTFVDLSGVETAYALTAGQIADGLKWFYQELFNPIVDAPTYNELFFVQSDNATADVVDATSTQRGLINTVAQAFAGIKSFIAGIKTDTVDEYTLNAGVTIDGVLLKDGLTDGRDVSADGGVLDAHVANTSNPHATTKAQVGLANVTNDAQLKRAAADFDSFTEKTALVNDDLFLIEDSEDSLNKKKVKRSNVGGGSGGGSRNFITNGDGESSTASPFTPYADAAASRPVDGTGGSPTVTTATTTTNPLDKTRSILLTKPAGNLQGQGWSAPFTIDLAQKAKAMKLRVKYIINSGTFVAGQNIGAQVDSDVIWYLYDITNARLIEPSSFRMLSNSATLSDVLEATFQTAADSVSYRLIAHVATTTAAAFELKVEVEVSESTYVFGSPMADEQLFTPPTSQGFGTLSGVELFQTRFGDKLKVRGRITLGTTTAVEARLGLPAGLSIKSGINNSNVGTFGRGTGAQANKGGFILAGGGNSHVNFSTADVIGSTSADPTANAVGTAVGNAGNVLFIEFEVPIQGWSSSVQMSDSADTRVVALRARRTAAATAIANNTEVQVAYDIINNDSHGSYNGTTGVYTVLVPGFYATAAKLNYAPAVATTGFRALLLKRNGITIQQDRREPAFVGNTVTPQVFDLSFYNAGDTITTHALQNSGASVNLSSDGNATIEQELQIQRVSGPASIAASEKIAARYFSNSGQSIPDNTLTIVNFESKTFDTHNAVTTGAAWKFTAQAQGLYEVDATTILNGFTGWADNETLELYLYKNNVLYSMFDYKMAFGSASNINNACKGVDTISLNAGDFIDVRMIQKSGSAITLVSGGGQYNFINVKRVI